MEKLKDLYGYFAADPWLRAGVIVALSLLGAIVVDWLVHRVLRALARRTQTETDDQLLSMFHRPVQVTVLTWGLFLAVKQLELDTRVPTSEGLPGKWEHLIEQVFQTVGVLVWTVFALRFCAFLLRAFSKDTKRFQYIETATLPLFQNLAKVFLLGLSVYFLILTWDADVTGFIASAGVAGIAIGFAAKDTLSNLFAGVFILADSPYRKGDFIVLDSGERGEVVDIGLRSTRLLTRDDIAVTIPNSVMGGAKILNETGGDSSKRRVRIPVGVAYGSDIDLVRATLLQVAEAEEMVCKTPEARVRFRAFGDSALDFELLCWIPEPVLRGRATDALLTAVYKRFQAAEIQIAFPQLDVHLHRS